MINNKLYRTELKRLNGANGRYEVFGHHGASGLRGLRCGVLSFIIYYLSFIISLTAITACSSDSGEEQRPVEPTPEPIVATEVPISFSGHEEEAKTVDAGSTKAATRAGTPLSEKSVTEFKVWGYKNTSYDSGTGSYDSDPSKLQEVFPGYVVKWLSNSAASTTTNSSGWEYILLDPANQTIKYWDWAAKAYRFFAVTGSAVADKADLATNPTKYWADATQMPAGPYEISMFANCSDDDGDGTEEIEVVKANMDKTPFFSRLWFSTGDVVEYPTRQYGQPVQLEFLKPYARVRYIFKYSYPREGIKLKKSEFKLATDFDVTPPAVAVGIARKGTVTISYPMTGSAIRESYIITPSDPSPLAAFTEDSDPEDDSKVYTETDEGWYYVLPNLSQGAYKMAVWINSDDVSAAASRTAVVPEQYMQWLPGYSYTYIFKILEEGGVEIELVQAAVTPWTEMEANRTVYNW